MEIGESKKNKNGTIMKIIEKLNGDNMLIEFQDKYRAKKIVKYINYFRGTVKNPYDKTVYGVGCIGEGKYKTRVNSKVFTTEYRIWKAILQRCYDKKYKNKYPCYYNICVVCDEWLNFQNFAEWYHNNYYEIEGEKIQLDKDILFKDNKIYSPETCMFVPQSINLLFRKKQNKRGLPNGIYIIKNSLYKSSYNKKYLGTYKTLDEAVLIHNNEKKKDIIKRTEKLKGKIPEKLYLILINIK